MEELNGQQNERIKALEVEVANLKMSFNRFISNDFKHLDKKVDRLFLLVLAGILIPILLYIIENIK